MAKSSRRGTLVLASSVKADGALSERLGEP